MALAISPREILDEQQQDQQQAAQNEQDQASTVAIALRVATQGEVSLPVVLAAGCRRQ